VFVSFDLLTFLAWLFLSTFIPGALLSLAIFHKQESLHLIEKLVIGFAMGFFLLPMVPFLLYLALGIKFSYTIALIAVAALYAVSLAAFFISKAYEDFKIPQKIGIAMTWERAMPLLLVLLLVVSYLVRIGSYSPVFQELDPYFYTYPAYQILTVGENPFDAQTAWYPEVVVNHRIIPVISYLESTWYSIYTGGGEVNNLLLALIASMYPPIAATFAVFFAYLLISAVSKREWGLLAGGLVAFAPISIFKLAAGEQEVQPYAFFAMLFFYAMYAFAMRKKDIGSFSAGKLAIGKDLVFPLVAGLAYAALALGSATQVLIALSLVIFLGAQAVLYFIRDDDADGLRHMLITNAIIFIIGPVIASTLLQSVFNSGQLSLGYTVTYAMGIVAVAVLYIIKTRVSDKNTSLTILGALALLALFAVFFTPVGDYIRGPAASGFSVTQFNQPLDRTIAEQGIAPTEFGSQMGFMAASYSPPAAITGFGDLLNLVMYLVLLPFSMVGNTLLAVTVGLLNFFLGTSALFTEKVVSLMLLWVTMLAFAAAFGINRFFKKEDDQLAVLILAIVMPPLIVGVIKAKFTLYATVMLAVAIGFVFSFVGQKLPALFKREEDKALAMKALFALAAVLVAMQFLFQGFAPSLLWGSLQPLYQNDPQDLAPKFQQFCAQSNDADVCAAASDPLGYASRGTNYQYSTKLCLLSVFTKYEYAFNSGTVPPMESQAAFFRCQRLSDYWVESMEWIKGNTENGSRVTSWWDYGHWINYFGLRNAVIRNEHASQKMIGDVAHGYLDATPEELKAWMKEHDSKYALFDIELVAGGGSLGGKYGALNYLSCARDNLTSAAQSPGESQCEADHLWENVFVTSNPCVISSLTNKTGFTAYKIFIGDAYIPDYPGFCVSPTEPNAVAYCRDAVRAVPAYCLGNVTLASGQSMIGTYYINETYPNGDLKLNKAILQLPYSYPTTSHFGPTTRATLFYTNDAIWLENGEVKSGYEDRKGKFYDSALYKAMFLNELPGFDLVYQTSGGEVKIFKTNAQ
jgi:asparagine N-glycosylation enzyme membrane subunit Stt3